MRLTPPALSALCFRVAPPYRSQRVGARLIDAVKALAARRGWGRIDVTAPESPAWNRTRRFYESQGFVFTSPKLKFVLVQGARISGECR